ncbi:hypothetical protein KI688_004741 [Linnemannia hyalina]|uniref:KANL3/Tex30 alpha/beta hydrolase-like domain-containing protein n=1 Tax=Linnemannia hyalina TaxID=64524 RepID=A0A9P7XL95_9FUNG|nr:hypothetical protein KI688_004741 [Linnemannia hyalina]
MAEPTEKEISVPSPGKAAIPVLLTFPPEGVKHSGFALLLGPGAGGDEKTALLTAVANEVARQGHFCARYRAKVPNLVAGTVAAQLLAGGATESEPVSAKKAPATKGKKAAAAAPAKKAASSTTTSNDSDFPTDFIPGLVLFSYPLHTADNTKALRDQILLDIPSTTATLFVSGLKDNMCQPSIFAKVFKEMKSTPREVVQVTDADHGLGFGSSKPGQAKKEALAETISEWTVAFMDEAIAQKGGEEGGNGKKKAATGMAIKKKAELKKEADEWTVAVSTVA